MKFKIKQKNYPGDNPGEWNDSLLKAYIKADKNLIEKICKYIANAINDFNKEKNHEK